MIDPVSLTLNPALDSASLRACYRRDGRVRIPHLFASGAPELYRHLESNRDWVQLANHETGSHELAWKTWRQPGSTARSELEPGILARARDGFQYSYAALRVPTADESCENPVLTAIADLLRGEPILTLLKDITGVVAPRFTDGQVTAYGEGDFLTGHDDDLVGSDRKVAFVLGLTPQWRLEWGGLLLFHDLGSVDCAGLVPQFNTLDLFSIPRYHSVSMVTRAAPRRRFSITGWLSAPD